MRPDSRTASTARRYRGAGSNEGMKPNFFTRSGCDIASKGILEDAALPSIEIIPKAGFYDYENKYQPGAAEEITPAPIPPEWEAQLAQDTKTVFDALGLSVYSRADFIVDESGTPWFLEINTLPGMTPTSLVPQEAAAAGISYDELCETIVNVSLKLRGKQ